MTTEKLFCLTVQTRPPESSKIMVFLEEGLQPERLIETIESGLKGEYRTMNSVAQWCFHFDDQKPVPGDFLACRSPELESWLLQKAQAAFKW